MWRCKQASRRAVRQLAPGMTKLVSLYALTGCPRASQQVVIITAFIRVTMTTQIFGRDVRNEKT